jgi:hypothetical protein
VLRGWYRHRFIVYHGKAVRLDMAPSGPILGATFRL